MVLQWPPCSLIRPRLPSPVTHSSSLLLQRCMLVPLHQGLFSTWLTPSLPPCPFSNVTIYWDSPWAPCLKVNSHYGLSSFLSYFFFFLSERILVHVLTWCIFCLSLLECKSNKKFGNYVHIVSLHLEQDLMDSMHSTITDCINERIVNEPIGILIREKSSKP